MQAIRQFLSYFRNHFWSRAGLLCSLSLGLQLSTPLTPLSTAPVYAAPVRSLGIEQSVGAGVLNWSRQTLTVTGSGAIKKGNNAGQQRLLAERAAQADAYRLLAEALNGVQVFAETTVKNYVTQSDIIHLQVSALVRGAKRVGKARYLSDGTVEVDLSLPIFGTDSLAQAVQFDHLIQEQIQQPYSSLQNYFAFLGFGLGSNLPDPVSSQRSPTSLAQAPVYTGLIIDASGLAAEPAMGPFIVGAGMRIHTSQEIKVNPAKIVQDGPLHYVEDLDAAKEDLARVGDHPLIVRAKAAIGSPIRSNILLDESTAAQVMELNEDRQFLEQLRVTLVL